VGLETATFINGLVSSNPVGATDPKSQGDDHIRLLKATILATFAAITGAVTASHTQINQTCVGTGGTFPAINGSALTNLSAANITAGGTLPALNGSALTNLNASNLATGTVADGRLSANIPLLNAANDFSGNLTVHNGFALNINASAGASALKIGGFDAMQWSGFALRLGGVTGGQWTSIGLYTNGALQATIDSAGQVSTNNTSASEIGKIGEPIRNVTASDNTAASDQGGIIRFTGGTGQTFTLDGDPPAGATLTLINTSGNNWTIAASGSVTLNGTAGSFTHATARIYFMRHLGAGVWIGTGF